MSLHSSGLDRASSLESIWAILLLILLPIASCSPESLVAPERSSTVTSNVPNSTSDGDDPESEVVVRLVAGVSPDQFGADFGASLSETGGGGLASYLPAAAETPAQLAVRMASDPRTLTSEPNAWIETAESRQQSFAFDDGNGGPQTYLDQPATDSIDLQHAHGVSRGQGVLVAILDTGADLTHPALASRIQGGWDFVSGDADPSEFADGIDNDADGYADEAHGHGTHVAGIIARTAPDAKLLIARVLDADGRGDVFNVAAAIEWATAQGARVINMSLGMLEESELVQSALEQSELSGNVIHVASAGNWGAEEPKEYPAKSSHVIAVAAFDTQNHPASFTSYGGFVDLSGPGVSVRSTYVGGGYALWSGTSMAAPFVSGTAALLVAIHPSWGTQEVLERLGQSARPLIGSDPELLEDLGAGALHAGAALAPDARAGTAYEPLTRRVPRRP